MYRDKKFVYLGKIVNTKNISKDGLKEFIDDAERTIIFYLSNIDEHELIVNIYSTHTTQFDHTLKIINIGYKEQLPKELFLTEDMLK